MIPAEQVPEISAMPVQGAPPLGGGGYPSQTGLGAVAPSSLFTWYPDIQPNNTFHVEKVTPGYGISYPVCGDVRFIVLCPDNPHHFLRANHHSCHRPECPICYPSWAGRAADRASSTIDGYKSATGTPYDARHITISPDPMVFPFLDASTDALRYLMEEGRRVCVTLGITAAAAIPHPYRIKKEYKHLVSMFAAAEGVNRYVWALRQDNWGDLVYFSPHIHLLAYGPLMDAEEFEHKTGWIYRNHDEGGDSGRAGVALVGTVFYLLTHAWVRGNHKAVRYWFGMSSRRLECRLLPAIHEPILCPVCESHAVTVPPDVVRDINEPGQPVYQDLHNAPHAYRKTIVRVYLVRVRKRGTGRKKISKSARFIWGDAGVPKPS